MEGKLAEHRALTSHIEAQFRLIIQVFTVSLVVSVALIGYGCQAWESAPYVFLTPIAVFLPCSALLITLREEIFRWGTYISVFLEDDKELKYETAIAQLRKKHRFTESLSPIFYTYWFLFFFCAALFATFAPRVWTLPWYNWFEWAVAIFVAFLFLGWLFWVYRYVPEKKTEQYLRWWKEVKTTLLKSGDRDEG